MLRAWRRSLNCSWTLDRKRREGEIGWLCIAGIYQHTRGVTTNVQKEKTSNFTVVKCWQNAQAVCFDIDSTVCREEGIDVLAEHCGVGEKVRKLTSKAMNGNVKFEEALASRLELIKPTRQDFQDCLSTHPPQLSPGIDQLIQALQESNKHVFFVSGGFRLMIEPVADRLNVPRSNIYANKVFFDASGKFAGFDPSEPTSRDGGKSEALRIIKKKYQLDTIVMVGDGATDMQAKPPADAVIGYGGVVIRDVVRNQADWFVTDFQELTDALYSTQTT